MQASGGQSRWDVSNAMHTLAHWYPSFLRGAGGGQAGGQGGGKHKGNGGKGS